MVKLESVSKRFGRGVSERLALDGISVSIEAGEFACIVGPSGCGKSTLLDILAGYGEADRGSIVEVSTKRVGILFQMAALFPWLTVRGNLRLALRLAGVPRVARDQRVNELLEAVRLSGSANLRPHELSGGMRQRVALARALSQDCELLLMDEPFSALDAITRSELHAFVGQLAIERGLTVILVTHDVMEAARLADRVIVMTPGPGRIAAVVDVEGSRPRQPDDPAISLAAAILRRELEIPSPRGTANG
jgi:NitT/TauT family transport system ATP-binding protein